MEISTTKLEAYLAIPMPSIEWLDRYEPSRGVLYESLDDLCRCSRQIDFPLGTGTVQPEIALLDEASRSVIGERLLLLKKTIKECEILRVCVDVPYALYDDISVQPPEGITSEDISKVLARSDFEKRVSDLLIMVNIARVGSVELKQSAIIQDSERSLGVIPEMDGYALQRAVRVAEEMNWPVIGEVGIAEVWRWAMKHVSMLEGFDGTPLGRAINAFSRIFERKTADEPMQLLWALVGLEALYVHGKAELLQQVREKSQVLLGSHGAFRKKISRMYDFRSRFVHGDLDFPGLCLVGDARDGVAKYDEGLFDAIAVAIAVLVASIQEIVRRDWSGLRFDYAVTDGVSDTIRTDGQQ